MQITAEAIGNCTILELQGKLVLGSDTIELRKAIRAAARNSPQKIILNLAGVSYVDSCGIGELVSNFTHVRNLGGSLVLTHLPEKVRILLDLARLVPIFEIFDSEQEAIANSRQEMVLSQISS